jgi:hypothetical protein
MEDSDQAGDLKKTGRSFKSLIRKTGNGFPSRQTPSVCAEIMLKQ